MLIATASLGVVLVAISAVHFAATGYATEIELPSKSDASAADARGEKENQPWKDSVPDNNDFGVKLTPMEYAKLIEPDLGVPPIVDCGENVEIPIYIDGVKNVGNPGIHGCDNPSLQVGDCMSGSSVGRYEGVTADGEPLPHVVWISYCRHEGRPGTENMGDVDSVQMIGHNYETGATAYYESGDNGEWTYTDPETNRLMGELPGTDDPEAFNRAYATVDNVQCVSCHQNDPFVHNPYIDSALLPGTNEPVIPRIATKGMNMLFDNPYYVIGASNWEQRTIHIEGNKCLGCHRIGMKTVELFMSNRWEPNEHMPPHDPGSLSDDFQALLDCWQNGPENTEGCDWIIPAAGDAMGRVVGDEYPYKAKYNKPSANHYADLFPEGNFDDDDDGDGEYYDEDEE
jgi:hypothetical protein